MAQRRPVRLPRVPDEGRCASVRARRVQALGGVVGPVAFVATWALLGTGRPGYSPVHDPISQLAGSGAVTRVAMTAGFVAFGAGVGLYAPAARAALGGGVGAAMATAAAASIGLAALPLGSPLGDAPHAAAAGVAYVALAAAPVLGARRWSARGGTRLAGVSLLTGVVVGASLAASILAPRGVGLAQRLGLTVADVWIVATAASVWRRPS